MPWPPGKTDDHPVTWDRCHFMSCTVKDGAARIVVVTPDRGSIPRFVCKEHRELIADAVRQGVPVMVTPQTIYGSQPVQGGTVWLNTITDFWRPA